MMMTNNAILAPKPNIRGRYKNRSADEKQSVLYKRFPDDSFLGNEDNADHFMQWVTFFRRNLHRFAMDYLSIKLHTYQIVALYEMGINQFNVIVASRATAKSFIIALFACCKCILYPKSLVVIASSTKGQSKLIISEKIEKELMNMSPALRKEIKEIKKNQNETVVIFRNGSTITVVPASENARGYRSTCLIREEFRMIKKFVDDSILSPFQVIRQVPYLMDDYYADIKYLQEESIDIYITSSWLDNGHWMWEIVDQAYEGMLEHNSSCLLSFDESVPLKHKIKTQQYYQKEIKKQDPLTWRIEFLNERVKENVSAFFSYALLEQNRSNRMPFYPRTITDFLTGKKNPYEIAKQKNEIRIVSCDMAFVTNAKNDNSIFTCMRLLPESSTYTSSGNDLIVDNGYRRIVSYIESIQGGDIDMQARRIRQLFNDFAADYICLDVRNAGIAVFDKLAKVMYDEERDQEYSPLTCMNDDNLANRIKIEGAEPRIYAISASQRLNSDIALDFKRVLGEKKIEFLCSYERAMEEIIPNIKEYSISPDADTQMFYESPFLETQALFSETTGLMYERKEDTGVIVVKESGSARKDRYTSCSYASFMASMLERDLASANDDYEYTVFIN